MSQDKPINLFEDVDIKNIKAEIVPAKLLYLSTLKWVGIILIVFWLTFTLYVSLVPSDIESFMIRMCFYFSTGFVTAIIGAGIPFAIIASYLWKYHFFKLAVSINLKHGNKICMLLKKYFIFLMIGMGVLHIAIFVFMLICKAKIETVAGFSMLHNTASFFICDTILKVIFRMELIRWGVPQLLQNINSILNIGRA